RAQELGEPARRQLPGALAPGGPFDRPCGRSTTRRSEPGAQWAAALLGGCCGGHWVACPAAHLRRGLCGACGLCNSAWLVCTGGICKAYAWLWLMRDSCRRSLYL